MSGCQIDIKFNREDRSFHPLEDVSGVVIVQSRKDIICRKIVLHLKGPDQSRVLTTLFNRKTEWKKGNVYTYPFKFPAPHGPMSYHGHRLSIDWYVRAEAAIQRSTKEKLLSLGNVSPSSEAQFYLTSDSPLHFRISSSESHGLSLYWMLNDIPASWGVIFGFSTVMASSIFGLMVVTRTEPIIIRLLLATALAIAGFYLLIRYLPIWLAERQLGQVEVLFYALPRNQGLMGVVRFTPKTSGQIQRIEMNLLIREIVTEDNSGFDDAGTIKVHAHNIFTDQVADTHLHHLNSNELFVAEFALKSDSPLPASYKSGNRRIEWLVTVKIVLSKWAIWQRKIHIEAIHSKYDVQEN